MDYREKIIRVLMEDVDRSSLGMAYGVMRGTYRNVAERKEAGTYVRPDLGRKMEVIKLLMEIDDSDKRFLNRVLVMLKRHNRKKGGAA